MRTILKVTLDVVAANKALMDGSLPKIMQSTIEKLKPEASYFFSTEGNRSCFFVFDMKDSSEMPAIAEPFFVQLNAKVDFSPVMNVEDLQKGLQNVQAFKH